MPVVTVTPNGRVGGEWWASPATATGFTIFLAGSAPQDIRFSWIALTTPSANTQTGAVIAGDTSHIFPLASDNIPVSSDLFWNACIRNITLLDAEGKPMNCARYHQEYTWTQPDLNIEFLWNASVSPAILHLPDGYETAVTEDAASIRNAFDTWMHGTEGNESSSSVSSEESSSSEISSATSETSIPSTSSSSMSSESSSELSSEGISSDAQESSTASEASSETSEE